MKTQRIEDEVNESYGYEKYKSFCEQMIDLELSLAYLQTKEGQEKLVNDLGRINVVDAIHKVELAIILKRSEAKFLKEYLNAKEKE